MENAGIFYGHLEYFTAVWCILWPVGNVVVIWYIFPLFGYCVKKNLATLEREHFSVTFSGVVVTGG
jgi:hypothetical protein